MMVRPKKSLGQHFLPDSGIAERIVSSLKAADYQQVVEVGPGKGVLTEFLLSRSDISVIPVEIDVEASEYLLRNFPEIKDKLITDDILRTDLSSFGDKIGLIGNFPYNISSQIFFRVLAYRNYVSEIVCMLQKEVAERIISPPGNKTYGILSVLLQTWYNTEYLFTVGPESFYPKPDVMSGVIRLTRNNRNSLECEEAFYTSVIKTAFNQRRKMLRNSVSSFFAGTKPEGSIYTQRPEQLSVNEFIMLAMELEAIKKTS
jgi:16S rRNA (adenine1518-N6/adenine1519-N6)-dimethyltransferase